MKIRLSDHFGYGRLLRFTLPSIVMMIFTSIYSVVDGFFVSNFVGKTPFAAVNFIYPFLMILGAPGFMFGTGGSALVSMTLGEGDAPRANRIFSMLIYVSLGCGIVLTVLGIALLRPIAQALGAQGEMLELSIRYGRVVLMALPAFLLQMEFQSFFITAERPHLGLVITVASGVTNMVLDALFVAVLPWGMEGAAAATALSQVVGGVLPLIYFAHPRNTSLLHLVPARVERRALTQTCFNGSSELMSNLSMSLVSMLYNVQLLRYAGENGLSAYGVLMYVSMVFNAAFIGYSIGTAPVIGYHYGAGHTGELKSLLCRSVVIILGFSVAMFAMARLLAHPLSLLFVGYDAALMDMTYAAFQIYAFAFLFMGLAIFASGFFTALNDGVTSALISFLRTLVFQTGTVLLLPLVLGLDGIWWSIVAAEVMAVAVSACFLVAKRKKYHYF